MEQRWSSQVVFGWNAALVNMSFQVSLDDGMDVSLSSVGSDQRLLL